MTFWGWTAKEKLAQGKSLPRTHGLLAIKSPGQISFVKARKIDWIEAADYYACLHLAGKTHVLRLTITDLEQELDPNCSAAATAPPSSTTSASRDSR